MTPGADAAAALGAWTRSGDTVEAHVCFPATLPVFLGHFPGNPLVPGVTQIAVVVAAITAATGRSWTVVGVQRAKWTAPLHPGVAAHLTAAWKTHAGGLTIDATLRAAGTTTLTVRVLVA